MGLSDRDIEQRIHCFNASEHAIIYGPKVYPFKTTQTQLWQEKVYKTVRQKDASHHSTGHRLEASLVEFAVEEWAQVVDEPEIKVRRNQARRKDGTIFRCTHDALGVGKAKRIGVEAKSKSRWTPSDNWGDRLTDQVPDHVMIQTQAQIYVSDLELVLVPLFDAEAFDYVLYVVKRNDELIEEMIEIGNAWWQRHVIGRVPPSREYPRLETLQRVVPEPLKVVQVDPWMVEDWKANDAAAKSVNTAAKRSKGRVAEEMGDAEYGDFGDEEYLVSYKRGGNGRVLRLTKRENVKLPENQEVTRVYATA